LGGQQERADGKPLRRGANDDYYHAISNEHDTTATYYYDNGPTVHYHDNGTVHDHDKYGNYHNVYDYDRYDRPTYHHGAR